MRPVYLTRRNIEKIHDEIIKSGGAQGLLFESNLDICVESPQQTIFGKEIHSDLREKAASLLYQILKLHPFLDGNKRTGYEATDVFLRLNGHLLDAKKGDALDTSIEIARCSMNMEQTALWVKTHTKRKPLMI